MVETENFIEPKVAKNEIWSKIELCRKSNWVENQFGRKMLSWSKIIKLLNWSELGFLLVGSVLICVYN